MCVGGATCDDTWSLSSHDSLRKSSKLLGEECRCGQRAEHRRSHRFLNAPQNTTHLILWKIYQVLQKYIHYCTQCMSHRNINDKTVEIYHIVIS